MVQLSDQVVAENPIMKAARANSTPVEGGTTPAQNAPAPGTSVSSSSSITTKSIETAPNSEDITTNSVIDFISENLTQAKAISSQTQAALDSAADNKDKAAKAVVHVAENQAVIDLQKDTAAVEADADIREAWKARGDTKELIRLSGEIKTAADEFNAAQSNVAKVVADTNPIARFFGLDDIDSAVEDANIKEASYNKLIKTRNNMMNFANNARVAVDAVKITNTRATAAAQGRVLLERAKEKQAQYEAESDILNAEKSKEALTMNFKAQEAEVNKWRILQETRTTINTEKLRERMAKEAAKKAEIMETWIDGSVKGMRDSGDPTYYGGDDPVKQQQQRDIVRAQIEAGGEMQARAMKNFEYGVGILQPTYFQTLNRVTNSNQADSLRDGSNPAKSMLQTANEQVWQEAKESGEKLTKDNFPEKINSKAQALYDAAEAEIKYEDKENLNLAAPLAILIANPEIEDRLPIANVIAPLLGEDVQDFSSSQVFQLIASGIKTKANPKGTYNIEDAVETYVAIYTKAAAHNTQRQDRLRLNIPAQTSYNSVMTPYDSFVGKDSPSSGVELQALIQAFKNEQGKLVLNGMDRTKVTRAMLKYLAHINRTGGFGADKISGLDASLEESRGKVYATEELLKRINRELAQ